VSVSELHDGRVVMASIRNERSKQEHAAWRTAKSVQRWHYICDDGETFSAIAPTEEGAFRVLNAERPGVGARFDGSTYVPAGPLDLRITTHDAECKCHLAHHCQGCEKRVGHERVYFGVKGPFCSVTCRDNSLGLK
jgi:hypothetical protein